MKKLLFLILTVTAIFLACKKTDKAPVGPTDIRILNLSDVPMNEVTVNTYDSTFNYGTIAPGDTSDYHTFDRAYQKANISAMINGLLFKTDTAIYTYQVYLSTVRATYTVFIKNEAQKKLEISNTVLEEARPK
jgi:hypothetical protein